MSGLAYDNLILEKKRERDIDGEGKLWTYSCSFLGRDIESQPKTDSYSWKIIKVEGDSIAQLAQEMRDTPELIKRIKGPDYVPMKVVTEEERRANQPLKSYNNLGQPVDYVDDGSQQDETEQKEFFSLADLDMLVEFIYKGKTL